MVMHYLPINHSDQGVHFLAHKSVSINDSERKKFQDFLQLHGVRKIPLQQKFRFCINLVVLIILIFYHLSMIWKLCSPSKSFSKINNLKSFQQRAEKGNSKSSKTRQKNKGNYEFIYFVFTVCQNASCMVTFS